MPVGVYERTKKHCENISKAKKGCKQQPQCGFQVGHEQFNTGRTRFKKGQQVNLGRVREDMLGENNHNWKGGITDENHKLRNTPEYREWRRKVFRRDYWTCRKCGMKKDKKIIAHHIKSFVDHEELRHDVSNGITLCHECHMKLHHGHHK